MKTGKSLICILLAFALLLSGCGAFSSAKQGKSARPHLFPNANPLPDFGYEYDGSAGELSLCAYSQLEAMEQEVYRAICYCIENFLPELRGPFFINEYILYTALLAVEIDHPEYFWVDLTSGRSFYQFVENGVALICHRFRYLLDKEEILEYQALIEKENEAILAEAKKCANEYETVKYLHDTIIDRVSYNHDAADRSSELTAAYYYRGNYTVPTEVHSAYSILGFYSRDQVVCAGYAKVFQYLLSKLGIWSTYARGYSEDVGHAWNIVQIDGEYYQFDLTWDDPTFEDSDEECIVYEYFGLTTKEIERDHVIQSHIHGMVYPECTADTYQYYKYNGLYFRDYEYDRFYEIIDRAVSNGEREFSVQFFSKALLEKCLQILIEDQAFFDILKETHSEVFWENGNDGFLKYSYSINEEQHILRIVLN